MAVTVPPLLFLDLCARVVGVVRTGPVLEGGLRASVQRIVCIRGGLALSIQKRGQIAVVAVSVSLDVE